MDKGRMEIESPDKSDIDFWLARIHRDTLRREENRALLGVLAFTFAAGVFCCGMLWIVMS